ncbi:hypothetical protein SDC9_131054 [bioreactor metagenome]|uniref:Uncharacterized protein n=1 Tax=bioreactor metagenome TaxID=1076179 RepID=A0A645D3U8_9ZZZZ
MQVLSLLQNPLHILLIAAPVALHPWRADGRALRAAEHAALQKSGVGGLGHFTAQGINLPHKLTFGRSADAGVTGHVAHAVKVDGHNEGGMPESCCGQPRLNAGMPRTDDDNIIFSSLVAQCLLLRLPCYDTLIFLLSV